MAAHPRPGKTGKTRMAKFHYLIILWFSLDLVLVLTQTTIRPSFIQPSSFFEFKLEIIKSYTNSPILSSPYVLYVGPRYAVKKSEKDGFHTDHNFNAHFYTNNSIPPKFESLLEEDSDHLKFNKHRKWTVSDFLTFKGVEFDVHQVTTSDGYILTIFRLFPCKTEEGQIDPSNPPQIVIYLHGFMSSCAEWLIGDPETLYPLDAVKKGNEVWLLNFRGSEYGMKHKRLSTLAPAFWKFSFHEQGVYDMPALVDYILEHTSVKRSKKAPILDFFGLGLGATVFYIFLDFHGPKYNDDINLMTGIAPAAFNSRSASPFRNLIPYIDHFEAFPTDGPFVKSTMVDFLRISTPELCIIKIRDRSLCDPIVQFFFGDGLGKTTPAILRRLSEHFPSTTSRRLVVHFLQLLKLDGFRQFDHGMKLNFLYYNQSAPPPYNLFNVQVPTITFYGQTDISTDPRDVELTLHNFGPSPIGRFNYKVLDYDAADFLFSSNLPRAISALITYTFNLIRTNIPIS